MSKLYKDFEKAQVKCVKGSYNFKKDKWNSKHFIYCEADLLAARLKERDKVIKQFEKFFDISDKEDEHYWEVGVNEIRDFLKKVKK